MSLGRLVLLLLVLAVSAGAVLLVEGNTTPVSLHLASFAARAEAPLWLVIAFAFLGGAIAAGLLAGSFWLIGPFFDAKLADWVRGLTTNPPAYVPPSPPPPVMGLLIVLLLATALLGSTILLRAALLLAFAVAGVIAALWAMALVRVGTPIELRARYGGLGGGQGGWRLSQPASLLLIATVLLGAAVGLAQIDRGPELPRPADAKPAPEPAPKKEASEKAPEAAKPAPSSPTRP